MPKVGNKRFAYDKAGSRAAAEYAQQTGQPVEKAKPKPKPKPKKRG